MNLVDRYLTYIENKLHKRAEALISETQDKIEQTIVDFRSLPDTEINRAYMHQSIKRYLDKMCEEEDIRKNIADSLTIKSIYDSEKIVNYTKSLKSELVDSLKKKDRRERENIRNAR